MVRKRRGKGEESRGEDRVLEITTGEEMGDEAEEEEFSTGGPFAVVERVREKKKKRY